MIETKEVGTDIVLRAIPFVYETILMILFLYKAGKMWNDSRSIKGLNLVRVLFQDQVLYFILYVPVVYSEVI